MLDEGKAFVCKKHDQTLFKVFIDGDKAEIICLDCAAQKSLGNDEDAMIHVFFLKSGKALCSCVANDILEKLKEYDALDGRKTSEL